MNIKENTMPTDETLNKLLIEALEKLELAIKETFELRDGKENYNISKLVHSIGLIIQFQEQIFERNPQLRPNPPSDRIPDPEMTKEQLEAASKLSKEQINEIDTAIISIASAQWQKVAKIVGMTMSKLPSRVKGIPDLFYARRIEKLVREGVLESQGNLQFMRYSEVRLKEKSE